MKLKIAHLYPDLLNLYGDIGNITTVTKRCEWRGIGIETPSTAARRYTLQTTTSYSSAAARTESSFSSATSSCR